MFISCSPRAVNHFFPLPLLTASRYHIKTIREEAHMSDLKVLITGASGGIGAAIARILDKQRAAMVLSGRNRKTGEELSEELNAASFIPADLEDPQACRDLVSRAADTLGGIDCLINCAGIVLSQKLEETTITQWDRIMNINARAPYLLCKEALPWLRKSERPVIVNIGSVVSVKGYPLQSAYAASKHAMLGFTKSLAVEVQEEGIRVHAVLPGGVDTPLVTSVRPDIDKSNLIRPEEVAETVAFLINFRGRGVIDEIRIHRTGSTPWQ
jgi:3-oxoacyl-[acyl-carrier protein] reductase